MKMIQQLHWNLKLTLFCHFISTLPSTSNTLNLNRLLPRNLFYLFLGPTSQFRYNQTLHWYQPTFRAAERNSVIVKMRDIKFPARSVRQHQRYWNNHNGKPENVTQGFAKSFFLLLLLFCFLFISFIYCRVWCSARVVRDNVNLGQQQETMQFHTTQQIGTITQIQSEADVVHLSPG